MISQLSVRNFKAFSDQSIPLAPLTVLTGLNGMGKSTALQSLVLLRQSYQQRLLPDYGLALNGDLIQIGTGQDALFEGNVENDLIEFSLITSEGLEATWRFTYGSENEVLKIENTSRPPDGIYSESLFKDEFHYLQAERLGPRASFEMSEYFVRDHRQLGTRGEYTAHYLALYEENDVIDALSHPSAEGNTLRHQLEAWMSEVSPGILFDFKAMQKMDRVQVGIGFNRFENFYRPTNVGFGITYVLPILVAILSSTPGTLILIENPEAHLHPRGQSQLANLIARAADIGIQIILETHSDHMLNGIRVAVRKRIIEPDDLQIHYFYRDAITEENRLESTKGVQIQSPKIDKFGKLDFWPDGFFDEYGKSLDELL